MKGATTAISPKNGDGKQMAAPAESALLIGALGVVYGDIGTSPLYTIKAAMAQMAQPSVQDILGILSLLFWMLIAVVSLKYVVIMLRADNRGEGGTLALMQLAVRNMSSGKRKRYLTMLGLIGACLFYGDTIITPAISVLSAIEGVGVISHRFDSWVVPVSIGVLAALFMVQSRGTAAVGKMFGPIMLVWFLTLGVLGGWRVWQTPEVLQALNPVWAFGLIGRAPWQTFLLLGALVLALTGAETLYADMGHFGRSVIRRAWFAMVLPALVLCYFGQGAVMLSDPGAARNPFFLMAPQWALVPLVVLATCATVIASQSVISGAFSVTRQAVQLGFWPRMVILHTSAREEGQIYLPKVNLILFLAVLLLVLEFGSSERLASAYGFAVTGTMLMTSLLAFAVLPALSSGYKRILWLVLIFAFLILDVLLFSSNALKIPSGGWVPLVVGAVLLTMMLTWKQGREQIHNTLASEQQDLKSFMHGLDEHPLTRVGGTAVYMSMIVGTVPPALLHNLKHNKVLHEQTVFLTVKSAGVPYVPFTERFQIEHVGRTSWQVVAQWGFKQEPNVPQLLEQVHNEYPEINLEHMQVSYFLSRQTVIVVNKRPVLRAWRRRLFALMSRNASRSTRFYKIPPNRVVEMGMQLEL